MLIRLLFVSIVLAVAVPARAQAPVAQVAVAPARDLAFEVNVLWPFFPGGLTELKVLVPLLRPDRPGRGELVVGLHSDFATRFVRAGDRYGKVSILAAKMGWRQFLAAGLHLDATVNAGWRHEVHNVWDGTTLDAFSARLWLMAGWQHDFNPRVYANARGGAGLHLVRTDRWAEKERKLVPAGDMNLGFRF
jgi:hypothetical protein